MTTITVPRGQRVSQTVQIIDPSTGLLDTRWTASDTPSAYVWAGQERARVALTAAWSGDPASGAKMTLTVTEAVSATLTDGRWPVDLLVTSGSTTTHVGGAWLAVTPSAAATNADAEPRSYITGRELRDLVGPFVDALQTRYGQTSHAQALALATADLDDAIARRYAAGFDGEDQGSAYDDMLTRLEDDQLTVTATVKRYVAWRAVWYLVSSAIGGGADLDHMRQIAAEESERQLGAITATVDGETVIRMGGAVRLIR